MSQQLAPLIHALKCVIFDIDGVFTNGLIYFCDDGHEYKAFHSQDGLGVKLLMQQNLDVAIISGRNTPIVERRFNELGVAHIYQGYSNKVPAYEDLLQRLRIQDHQVAYVGDDLPDLPLIQRAGLGIAVANATSPLKQQADWVTTRHGGQGAVREICDFILQHQHVTT